MSSSLKVFIEEGPSLPSYCTAHNASLNGSSSHRETSGSLVPTSSTWQEQDHYKRREPSHPTLCSFPPHQSKPARRRKCSKEFKQKSPRGPFLCSFFIFSRLTLNSSTTDCCMQRTSLLNRLSSWRRTTEVGERSVPNSSPTKLMSNNSGNCF